jgi:hypothetical protein
MVKQEVSYLCFNVNYVGTQHAAVALLKKFCVCQKSNYQF